MTITQLLIILFYLIPVIMSFICTTIVYIKNFIAVYKLNNILFYYVEDEDIAIGISTELGSIMECIIYYMFCIIPIYNIYYMTACIEDLGEVSVNSLIKEYIEETRLEEILTKNGYNVEELDK